MKLFLISQDKVDGDIYYSAAVVAAESENDARTIHPSEYVTHVTDGKWMGTYGDGKEIGGEYEYTSRCWVDFCDIDYVEVDYIGETEKERGVICASFNAG